MLFADTKDKEEQIDRMRKLIHRRKSCTQQGHSPNSF